MPLPSIVLVFAIVGAEVELLQQIPRDVIGAPPSALMLPPPNADVCDIEEIVLVEIPIGNVGESAENDNTFPYTVPAAFVAYALT